MGKCKKCRFFDYNEYQDLFNGKLYFCRAWESYENEDYDCFVFEPVPELKKGSGQMKCKKCRHLDVTDTRNFATWGTNMKSKCVYRYEYVQDDDACDLFEAPAPLSIAGFFDYKCEDCVHSSYDSIREVYFCYYRNTVVRDDNRCSNFAKPPALSNASSEHECCKRCCYFDQFNKKTVEKGIYTDKYTYYCKKTHRYVSEKSICEEYKKYRY